MLLLHRSEAPPTLDQDSDETAQDTGQPESMRQKASVSSLYTRAAFKARPLLDRAYR
jgi:hypothetical protein